MYFYNTLNRTTLAGQDPRVDYSLGNREDSILACIGGRYSKGLQIKNPGLTDTFTVLTLQDNYSIDEESFSQRNSAKQTLVGSSERKYEFSYSISMSLVSAKESVYTKIVTIVPKFILVNKLGRALCVAQAGNEHLFDIVESGQRKEWVWQDASLADLITVKKVNEDADRDWGD